MPSEPLIFRIMKNPVFSLDDDDVYRFQFQMQMQRLPSDALDVLGPVRGRARANQIQRWPAPSLASAGRDFEIRKKTLGPDK